MLLPKVNEPDGDEIFNPLLLRLQSILSEARMAGESVAVLLVHCGGVEKVDSQQGFHAGDQLSNTIENMLRTVALRKLDIVEPLSRDEFVCILKNSPSEGVATLAAHRIKLTFNAPLTLGDRLISADSSVGIAMFPHHGANADFLLQRAKAAQQSALKQSDRFWVHSENDASPINDDSQYETRLRLALLSNSLSIAFQSQQDIRISRIVGAEALLRWDDDILGSVPPSLIVAVAEQAGLMDQLTYWVITSAIRWCAQFVQVAPAFNVSINISPTNLREPDLPRFIDRALRTWGVDGRRIVIEITETAMMVNQEEVNIALDEMKSYGVRLSVDDFGTGYSSMYYLAKLPIDELKIDQMFVRDMLTVPVHAKIVRSLIELAQNLELEVVAEGVESEDIQVALQHLGCDRVQGFHISRPVSGEDLLERLKDDYAKQ